LEIMCRLGGVHQQCGLADTRLTRTTSTRLHPARTSANSPSSALHCCQRQRSITGAPLGGSPEPS